MFINKGTQLCFTLVLNVGMNRIRHPNRIIMDATNNVRESIISILRKENSGLSITDISEKIGMNRRSVTKYIYQLLGEGLLYHRKVGTAKLCYLKVKRGRKKYKR